MPNLEVLMKLKIILTLLVTFSIVFLVFSYFFNTDTSKVAPKAIPSGIIVNSGIIPSFVSLRFQNVAPSSIEGIESITPEKFEECLKYLQDNNYHYLSAKEVYDFMVNKVPVPEKSVWLTFDEGMESAYTYASPLLKKYEARATVFVGIVWLKKPYRLTNNQLTNMSKSGIWDIQTHGYTGNLSYPINRKASEGNFYLNRLWQVNRAETVLEYKNRVKKDLSDAFKYIRENFNSEKFFFAYPFGESLNSLDYENSMTRYLLECLDELNIIGIGKNENSSISVDWSTKKHFITRSSISYYTDLETILSPKYTSKKIVITDDDNTFTPTRVSYLDPDTLLCWDNKCNFIFMDNYFQSIGNIINLSENFSKKSKKKSKSVEMNFDILSATLLDNTICMADAGNKTLTKFDKNWYLKERYTLSFKPVSIWNKENEIYLMDDTGLIYNFTNKPCPILNSGISSKKISACAFGDTVFIVDDIKKNIYMLNYIEKRFIKTVSYSKENSIIPQYGLGKNEFIAWDVNNERFVKVRVR